MREKVKALWKLCFDDSEEFVEMYFRLRYNNKVNIAIESGDKVIAALQMLPYPMTFCGSEVPTAYVSGACTHPDHRNRGVMNRLLSEAFGRMYRNGTFFSTLIPAEPWLFGYYARTGYATAFRYEKRTYRLPKEEIDASPSASENEEFQSFTDYNEEAYHYLNRKMHERSCCLQHTDADFRVLLADLKLSGGAIFTLSDECGVRALAVAYPDVSPAVSHTVPPVVFHIGELFSDTPETEHALLTHICKSMEVESLNIITPCTDRHTGFDLGMIRIIQALPVLRLYAAAHPEEKLDIALTDEYLPVNNGYYRLAEGQCTYHRTPLPEQPHEQLTIGQLAIKLFPTEQTYMSLMLN
ncbi:GNAT family N-acetyltransferase [uncultured Bacteroides sp.]|uniref:GNAT family N-acetyltransferase n=1 Tax=uncultured Bacteroides sp. TaxID=162156 RepID=UPI0025E5E15B|nr:GNAT family N-acetyltransferase [uncultured Bacteroides sp.]